jgi:thioredoxin-related protein
MKFKLLLLCLSVLVIQQATAQEKALSIMDKAYNQAKEENKNVFLMFHASWCGWCKKMDANMQDESCKEFFDRNYVITHLVVKESEKNKHLENPGADDLLKEHKGEGSGIPFWLIFDTNGKLLEDSFNSEMQNLGCPATEDEVALFIRKLEKTSDLTDKELNVVKEKFLAKE